MSEQELSKCYSMELQSNQQSHILKVEDVGDLVYDDIEASEHPEESTRKIGIFTER